MHCRNENALSILQILLVTSSSHPDQWIVPGGGIEPDETSDVAALREVIEEAGVQGRLGRLLGIFQVIYHIERIIIII